MRDVNRWVTATTRSIPLVIHYLLNLVRAPYSFSQNCKKDKMFSFLCSKPCSKTCHFLNLHFKGVTLIYLRSNTYPTQDAFNLALSLPNSKIFDYFNFNFEPMFGFPLRRHTVSITPKVPIPLQNNFSGQGIGRARPL